ncbi:hypothetical protein SMACR_06702 [Sordaria macrospora]|uniref:WGS project CABT00000000 data, contig 2.13 n=2 Tax=Sordaria macrospora TaxID=5147 RepID=F7VYD7_SORMK|nr:uncharacterized protein SMAC_06702 [Sordaria macrospora k-hell]KAA8632859.1 hypothetical protein SMACR_06702 [Sordaria macrospora]KAH7631662.1 hypothetical protein B0T09DRAFT_107153 [Sordaria sp. MPI-SDFR-AT-0083]CCC10531.1 unnamed protein product [Sordaria macrospora k-hell]
MDDKSARAAANAPEVAAWEHTPYQGIERAPSPQRPPQHILHPEGQPGLEPAPHSTLELSPHQISDHDKLSSYGPTSTTLSSGTSPYSPTYVLPQPYGYSQQHGNIGSVHVPGGTSTLADSSAAAEEINDKEAGNGNGNGNGDGDDGKNGKSKRYCFGLGTKRQVAWSLLAIGIFLIVVGVAVGVGVGVSSGNKKDGNRNSPSTPTPTSSSTAHPSWTHTANLPPPTAYATITPSTSIICPSNNLTLYTPSNGTTLTSSSRGKGYLLICGRDYSSLAGAEEITNRQADSIETCIDRCAEVDNCIGAGWGNYEGKQICWLKSRLGNPGWTPDWYMAVREDAVLHDGSEGGLGGDTESG